MHRQRLIRSLDKTHELAEFSTSAGYARSHSPDRHVQNPSRALVIHALQPDEQDSLSLLNGQRG